MRDPGEVCLCGHHREEHDGAGECWALVGPVNRDVFCACLSYEETERSA